MRVEKKLHIVHAEADVIGSLAILTLSDEHMVTLDMPGPTEVKLALPLSQAQAIMAHHKRMVKITVDFDDEG